MRGVAVATIAVAGLGLFGTGVHGLAQVDGKLADAEERSVVRQVRDAPGAKGDCPFPRERHRYYERREL
jgi:hypothetical protein